MRNRMKWLVAFGSLMFAAGCGPMESEETLDAAPSGDVHAEALTCEQKCSNARQTCISGCGTNTICLQGCRNRYEICMINCDRE